MDSMQEHWMMWRYLWLTTYFMLLYIYIGVLFYIAWRNMLKVEKNDRHVLTNQHKSFCLILCYMFYIRIIFMTLLSCIYVWCTVHCMPFSLLIHNAQNYCTQGLKLNWGPIWRGKGVSCRMKNMKYSEASFEGCADVVWHAGVTIERHLQ